MLLTPGEQPFLLVLFLKTSETCHPHFVAQNNAIRHLHNGLSRASRRSLLVKSKMHLKYIPDHKVGYTAAFMAKRL